MILVGVGMSPENRHTYITYANNDVFSSEWGGAVHFLFPKGGVAKNN